MKFMKKNRPDVMIIILLILLGIYEIFVVPFEYDTLVSIFVGFNLVYLFPWCCKETICFHIYHCSTLCFKDCRSSV